MTGENPDHALIETYLTGLTRRRGTQRGTPRARRALNSLLAWAAQLQTDLTRLTRRDICEWAAGLPGSGAAATLTRKTAVDAARGFYTRLAADRVVAHNPAADLSVRGDGETCVELVTADERLLICALPAGGGDRAVRDRALLALFFLEGLRLAEITALKLAQLDIPGRTLACRDEGGVTRTVRLTEESACALDLYVGTRYQYAHARTDHLFVDRESRPVRVAAVSGVVKRHAERVIAGRAGSAARPEGTGARPVWQAAAAGSAALLAA